VSTKDMITLFNCYYVSTKDRIGQELSGFISWCFWKSLFTNSFYLSYDI